MKPRQVPCPLLDRQPHEWLVKTGEPTHYFSAYRHFYGAMRLRHNRAPAWRLTAGLKTIGRQIPDSP